jgi:2-polyprenyl-6-hydroxyphenyl methylase/3-demethylubiquinone-9 3-methyltransferase
MWGSAPFERIAGTLADMHETVVQELAGKPGERWLDIGCGTGELAMMASASGADVTGSDLSPTLVETATRQAAERGAEVTFLVADAEALPFEDASFDIVSSSIGAIFAPDHAQVAVELARVCTPGGRLGLTAWETGGSIDQFFQVIARYAPPPAPGAGVAADWGDEGYCRQRLGEAFELSFRHPNTPWAETADEMYAQMAESFGPIKTLLGALDPERAASFRTEILKVFAGMDTGDGRVVFDRPYLLALGTRR